MNLVGDILHHRSLAVVGLEKNTGKTECLNYILRNLPAGTGAAVTSIGTDGERTDAVTRTAKPEIWLREGTVFGTAEKYYAVRGLVSEVLDVGIRATALGRTVTARALSDGKVMLSGPPSTGELKLWMDTLDRFGVKLTIVDGALSRMSSASPAITDAMVLSTGAAFSADMGKLVRETAYKVELIGLPLAGEEERIALKDADKGIWKVGEEGRAVCINTSSSLGSDNIKEKIGGHCRAVYIAGALTRRLLDILCGAGKEVPKIIVADFTKIFISSADYKGYLLRGGAISVLRRSRLLAVCVNPVAPNGIILNSDELVRRMSEAVPVPVYDIMKV